MQETSRDVVGAGGVRLAVRELPAPSPGAPGLLLLHGLASSQHIWDLMLPRLTRSFRVLTYDARGHGRSPKPDRGYGFATVVADALAVLDATGLRRPVVAGHSWGAMVTLELAARHPDALSAAVLVDGGLAWMRDEFSSWTAAKEALAPPLLAGLTVEEFRAMIRTFAGEALEVTPDVEDIVLSVMRVSRDGRIRPNLSRANHFRILRAIWDQDPFPLHAALRVPTLAVMAHRSGDRDEAGWEARKRAAAARLRSEGAPTKVVWVEGIHDVPLQHPEALARRLERFAASAVR
jgi:pimeloyl-ACP methyl ester carboxylesterase